MRETDLIEAHVLELFYKSIKFRFMYRTYTHTQQH